MMWTKAQVRQHTKALATANKWDERVRNMEELAKHAPAFADRIAELRVMVDTLKAYAQTAIAIDPSGS